MEQTTHVYNAKAKLPLQDICYENGVLLACCGETLLTAHSVWIYSVLKGDILSLRHCCLVWGLLCITAWLQTVCHMDSNYCPIKPVFKNIQLEGWLHSYSHWNKTTLPVIHGQMFFVRLLYVHRLMTKGLKFKNTMAGWGVSQCQKSGNSSSSFPKVGLGIWTNTWIIRDWLTYFCLFYNSEGVLIYISVY